MRESPESWQPLALDPDADCLNLQPLLGDSPAFSAMRVLLGKFALPETSVLIRGESGTGKALMACTLHQASPRRGKPFVVLTCGTVPADTLQAQLLRSFEVAEGGTLLFKDIDALALEAQASLLRILHDKSIQRTGSGQPVAVNVRVLATSAADLVAAVIQGRLRKDLYYRLNVLELVVPPLRERRDDLVLLARHFLQCDQPGAKRRPCTLSEGALAAMAQYAWPGNVRELASRVRRGWVVAEGLRIEAHDLGLEASLQASGAIDTLEVYKDRAEREALRDVLYRHGHNLSRAAKVLGVSRPTFYRLLHKHGLR